MSNTDTYNITVTSAGAQPTPPATLSAYLINYVTSLQPGITTNLPGIMIEDLSSTALGALVICDTAAVETTNSLSPLTANPFILSQLGQVYIGPGAAPAVPTNTSVYIIFTGTVGFPVNIGFTVGDGTYQYIVQDGGIIQSGGSTVPLFCQASISGSWAIPANTVTELITSVPSTITLSCTNPEAGTPGNPIAETEAQFRARVLQAGQAIATGTAQLLKTLLGQVPGVQQRLISVVQQTTGWEIIAGGGDPYATAEAIFDSGINLANIVGSTLAVTAITQAANGQVTTDINHGYATGQAGEINGVVGMTPINGVLFTVASIVDEKNFTININTSGYPAYISGGVVMPNLRNVTANIYDYPDTYAIIFVNPPQQTVTVAVTWNTTAPNFISQAAIAQLAAPAVASYISSVTVGQPLNLLLMADAFCEAVANVLSEAQISVLDFAVSINGVSTPPQAGTNLIFGDSESYMYATSAGITVTQS